MIELLSATGKSLSELLEEIHRQFGNFHMVESDFRFSSEDKARLVKLLIEDRKMPGFGYEIDQISLRDGLKVYFANGGWINVRFSGTEPLLRVFVEMENEAEAEKIRSIMKKF